MLLRLLYCAVTPPPPNISTITPRAYVMANPARIGAEGNHGNGTRATSAVGSSSPCSVSCRQPSAFSLQPSAVSIQPPASSLQPLTRATRSHRQALRTVQPTSHPSGDNQAITDLAAFAPWPIQCERQPRKPAIRHTKSY